MHFAVLALCTMQPRFQIAQCMLDHTWYLPQAPQSVPVEKKSAMWRSFLHAKDCQLEKCLHSVNMEKNLSCGEMGEQICHVENFLHIRNVETNLVCHNSGSFVAKSVLMPFLAQNVFVAIYALLCGEKYNQKLCLWRKKDKYQVCAWHQSSKHNVGNINKG